MANSNKRDEPLTAPPVDRWFDLSLGSSFQDNPSSKFCTLRYEFKPASIDKNQPGKLHKTKDNKVAVEFQNNQPGKPKVSFEGSSEDYKDNDAVLFFDGSSFRLERLHRSVKRLRHVRQPGESAAVAAATLPGTAPESSSPPLGKGSKLQSSNKSLLPPSVEVERIEIGNFKGYDPKNDDDDLDEQLDILNDDDDDDEIDIGRADNTESAPERQPFTGIDINIPHQNETDDEIAEVDVSDDEGNKGPNAAEALRAQVNAEERKERSSSSSDSSGSSSGSGSGSSSSSSSSGDSSDGDGDSVSSI
ncbi:lisH domain-containing protein C1711.05 isoform X2 [Cynara cardunculus var. scolymus]|uniref:lisH domain-containing protein C1711.05 isoform X2 n=1 Tax=Cynara cardunculus var. scolymus TaxID=59895 RepID=UPI000D62EEFF|nr:lisH domain-containing protein C1711.05 isoform X2 [Cynara cardunculus var. scolymus]